MKRVLYIGQYSEGTTSKMRADALKTILKHADVQVIDTHIPFFKSHSLWRSFAFRFKCGKVITRTNDYILKNLAGHYDLIWVDKAVFISPKITKALKANTGCLVHYTPDTAFKENQSQYFYKSLAFYDYAITTKSFEQADYLKILKKEQLIFSPQGFNKAVHYPRHIFEEKTLDVVFIGLYEPSRGELIDILLSSNINVAVAGKNWKDFTAKHKHTTNFRFLGEGLFGEAYAKTISEAKLALGLLSKRFPELHTTRTFEIPACGTALVTEKNSETTLYYDEDEAIFFHNHKEMIKKIKHFLSNEEDLKQLTQKGYLKVKNGGYDYQEQLKSICQHIGILSKANYQK